MPGTVHERVEAVMLACLPSSSQLENHYLQLVAASQAPAVARAYREGRVRLDAAVQRILDVLRWPVEATLVIAVVDGSAVAAISEGRDVRETARGLLVRALTAAESRQTTAG